MTQGTIFAVKHFEMHDGDGLRTTVFLKGCPLRCLWCHNPEGISPALQLALYAEKCVSCGLCAAACPRGAHMLQGGAHRIDRAKCTACGACESVCPQNALKRFGIRTGAEALLRELTADADFYRATGGGVTLSGGEPLLQPQFCAELLCALRERGIHTAVDTSLCVPRRAVECVAPHTDLFLVDVKAADGAQAVSLTGQGDGALKDNLRYLDGIGKRIEVRIPFVRGVNEGTAEAAAGFLSTLRHLSGVKVLPYHGLAETKYAALGMSYALAGMPSVRKAELQGAKDALRRRGLHVIEDE